MGAFHRECQYAGVDEQKLNRLAKRLEKLLEEFDKMNVTVFAAGHFRSTKQDGEFPLVLGDFNSCAMDGGDGTYYIHEDGFIRGE